MVFGWFFEGKKKTNKNKISRWGGWAAPVGHASLSLSLSRYYQSVSFVLVDAHQLRSSVCCFSLPASFFFFSFPLANTFFSLYFSRNPQIDFELNTIKFKKKRVGGAISLRELDLIFVFWLVPRPHSSSISSPTHSSFIIIIFFLFFKKKKKCLPYSSSNNRKVGNCS